MDEDSIKDKVLAWPETREIAGFLVLTGLATVIPLLIHIQWFTGPLVNALLILLLFLVGRKAALLACFIPSLMALAGGLLPPVMAPALPFIMLGNVLFVVSIDLLRSRLGNADMAYWAGVFLGSLLKFTLIFCAVRFLLPGLLDRFFPAKVLELLSWPQLYTALLGGAIAWLVLKAIRRI